ncbi:MAG: hypothetical protein IJD97_06915 [Clostridia bacterium]|nr:hypothetical protein [Clostridia bacterium]
MKKIFALILASVMVFALAACTRPEENLTLGGTLKKQFVEITDGGETDPYTIAETLMTNPAIEFMPMVTEIDPGIFLQGFTLDEVTGFEKGAMFGPMIGSIPFIGYIFSLSEDADIDGFINTLTENADLRWNICVSADEMHTEKSGTTVFFLMSPLSLEQEVPEENQEDVMDMPIDELPGDEPAAMPAE